MKITEVRLGKISVPLRVPFKTALRSVDSVEDVVVEIHKEVFLNMADDEEGKDAMSLWGHTGYGEAPPTGAITGDTTGAIIGAIQDHIAKSIIGMDVDDFEDVLQKVQKCVVKNSSAKAAVDIALWDLYGQLYKIPVYKLMGGARKNIVTDITISVNDPETMAADAINAIQRGYDCLKIKVGVNPKLDIDRLAAVRKAVGDDVCIRIDANTAWEPKEAVRILNGMQEKGLQIELVEQPVKAHDLEGLKYVTENSYVPVLADESVFSPEDAVKIMQMRAADLVNIKLMKCGGLYNALKIVSAAEVYGVECMLGCMLEAKISRSDLVIALGGGVIGDLAGFAASSYLRGVRLVQIPTSLLAQVDSSVGGKVAVDLPEGKNLVGAFYQPSLVLIDPLVLNTLKERFINDGMGEVIKYGCIKDADLFSTLESHSSFEDLKEELPAIITRCVDIKRMVVENDQFDTGERMLLNFGHTLAHTIEQHFHYQRESHGEAVAIGMYQITRIAEEKGLTPKGTADRIQQVLKTYGLPFECGLTLGTLTEAIALDKKNLNGNLNVILLHEIGDSYIKATDIQFFAETARLV